MVERQAVGYLAPESGWAHVCYPGIQIYTLITLGGNAAWLGKE